ncbi:DUF429 domain-containing protein [Streptomyces sp. SID13031]|uniref:DUF429 domain-containing protein n=1 Tax=Streptomyces sp. SID13031 TaxID=2706046 RepID=UPI0013CA4DD4|nr:DUF429 domain-containing protein [Streptomyces sp. SID13031]
MPRVLGVDACKAGWVGVLRADGNVSAFVASTMELLIAQVEQSGPLEVIAIDIPIGLPDTTLRAADHLARSEIGRLSSSAFTTAVRTALQAPTHAEAVVINRRLSGQGVSIQAYGLRARIFEVETWIRQTDALVVEVHPEVVFARLAGAPLTVRKSTWAGAERRRALLADAGITLQGELGLADQAVGVDDVLDAGAAAWSALRVAQGKAESLPNPPELFTDNWPAAIWV